MKSCKPQQRVFVLVNADGTEWSRYLYMDMAQHVMQRNTKNTWLENTGKLPQSISEQWCYGHSVSTYLASQK